MQNCNIVVHDNSLYLEGIINFDNAKKIMLLGCQFIDNLEAININLKDLKASDSSGLAVIVAWVRYVANHKKVIQIYEMPQFLSDLSKASGLDQIFPIASYHE
jgi:phospholipid transport system transporter-binding protein